MRKEPFTSDRRERTGHPGSFDATLAEAFRSILKEASAAFAVTRGPAHILISANDSFRALVDGHGTAALGRPITEVFALSGLRRLLDRAYRHRQTVRDEVLAGSHEGMPARICRIWPLLPDSGPSDGLVIELRERRTADAEPAVRREIAERLLLGALREKAIGDAAEFSRASAERASQTKSEFLGHLSHELRTPLDVIGGYVELLDLDIHGALNEAQRADLHRIRRSQQHLLVMINDILKFMQTESGKLTYRTVDVPAHTALRDAVGALERLIAEKQLVTRVGRCDRGITAWADPDRTHQILINLLTNAVKYTPAGGEITVECDATEDTVHMCVIDTGIGIAPDRVDAVFEPFVQASSNLTESSSGVGLGLAISRELAHGMNGDISAESTPGEGSRFTLSLPRAPHYR